MVSVGDWSETPASNVTIDGISIAENCPPANINNAMRSMAAGVKTFKVTYDTFVASVSGFMPSAGGTFSGTQPKYTAEGAFLHHASSSNLSGKVSILPEGSANPSSPANGDLVLFYS